MHDITLLYRKKSGVSNIKYSDAVILDEMIAEIPSRAVIYYLRLKTGD